MYNTKGMQMKQRIPKYLQCNSSICVVIWHITQYLSNSFVSMQELDLREAGITADGVRVLSYLYKETNTVSFMFSFI